MIYTYSKFYYGFTVTEQNKNIDFTEAGTPKVAVLELGNNTLSTIVGRIQSALNIVGDNAYSVTVDRSTRKITITSDAAFEMPFATGPNVSTSFGSSIGFTTDRTGALSYEGDLSSGSIYEPQFKLQNFLSPLDNRELVKATINESTSGALEIVTFGQKSFYEFNIIYITNRTQPAGVIKNNPQGVESARAFLNFAINKRPVEIIPDIDDVSVFDRILLESTDASGQGTSYRLREEYGTLPDYFETGLLRWRLL